MAKRGFNASIPSLSEEQLELLKFDMWHRKRSKIYKKDCEILIKTFESFKGKYNN